jgi:hypothetical protein
MELRTGTVFAFVPTPRWCSWLTRECMQSCYADPDPDGEHVERDCEDFRKRT